MGHVLALRSDGTVAGAGFNLQGQATGVSSSNPDSGKGLVTIGGGPLSNIVSIAAGQYFSLALTRDGRVIAWGEAKVPKGLSDVVAIAARGDLCLALKADGTVTDWGTKPWVHPHVPSDVSNVVAIAAGGPGEGSAERSMALRKDGKVIVWGGASPPEEPSPPELTNAVAIASGGGFSLALKSDGTVYGWGFNSDGTATGVPPSGSQASERYACGLVRIDGQILTNVVSIAAGTGFGVAVKSDGTVVSWGDKRHYLGAPPTGLSNIVAVAVSDQFGVAIQKQ
jgi:alpha-tubulin suppressor-like RCC1 family protein